MTVLSKKAIKQVLGELPFTAEVYWQYRQQGRPLSKSFSLQQVEKWLPTWCAAAETAAQAAPAGKRVAIFATLRYWIEHAVLMGVTLAGMGHQVTLIYLPYSNWRKETIRFDLRRQNAYSHKVLDQAVPHLQAVSLLDIKTPTNLSTSVEHIGGLPPDLAQKVEEVAFQDVQYTLQVEDVDRNSDLYKLRIERNFQAARAAKAWLETNRPEVLLTANGTILEFGAAYQVARHLDIPVVTYEFGEQRHRIWLAQNLEVMHQETDALWEARHALPLSEEQWEQTRALFASRQRADLWENFSRQWQGLPTQGGAKVRADLGLDEFSTDSRPVVLLAANVIGDSLTLGRQVFTDSMTEWLRHTARLFEQRDDVQLVIRIHPGERYTKGPSVANVIRSMLPDLPAHIHLVEADSPINTYDLIEVADIGLVYTTTVGMEMAMSGVPVIVAGQTHYRGKGFTLDPDNWDNYLQMLNQTLSNPEDFVLDREQVEQAWNYAYRFFFEYPCPYPWHLLYFWEEQEEWSMERVLSNEGQEAFGETFRYLLGEPINWSTKQSSRISNF
ncbi:MAG: hypothetical protein PVF74_13765 [Anaerolineales bacterium]|jgi:hypothetical protein